MGDEQRTPNGGDTFNSAALTEAVRERLLAARGLNAPTFAADTDPLPEPGVDQIWRARWEKTATAVLLLTNPDNDHVRVAAVTFDPDLADSNPTVTSANGTTIGIPAVLWLDVAQTIPLATLDAHLGDIRTPSPHRRLAADELRHFQKTSTRRIDDGVMRASVIDDLHALATASWVPETGGDITQLLAGIRNSALAEAIDVTPADALQIKRGQRPLQPDEAIKLAPLTGHPVEELVAAANPLPAVVIELFNTPSVRARISKLATAIGADETVTRRDCAYGVYAAAARATGPTPDNERDQWRRRINQYLDTHLPEDD
jgi:hypothetical protein